MKDILYYTMPTLVKSTETTFLVPKGTHLYLSNECSETPMTKAVSPPHLTNQYLIFSTRRDLYFSDNELVGANPVITLFRLNEEDWSTARYIVVNTEDVVVIDEIAKSIGQRYKLTHKRFLDEL